MKKCKCYNYLPIYAYEMGDMVKDNVVVWHCDECHKTYRITQSVIYKVKVIKDRKGKHGRDKI